MNQNKKRIRRKVILVTTLILLTLLILRSCLNNLVNDCDANSLIKDIPTIIIDPGHGGFDGGAEGLYATVEKDINLSISLKLRDILNLIGFNVVLIRDGDYSLEDDCSKTMSERKTSDMKNRLKFCENYDNPIFISIHQNKFDQSNCKGTQIFYGKNNNKSKILAEKLQNNFKKDIDQYNNREIKKGEKNLFLLYNAKCPIVLIECGFISNPTEAQLLISEDYQQKISFVIMKTLLEFVEEKDKPTNIFFKIKR